MAIKYGLKELEEEFGRLTFARALKSRRLCEEMTQVQMAKLIKISKQSLNDLENGRTLPSIQRAADIADKIGHVKSTFVKLAIQDHIDRAKLGFEVTLQAKKNPKKAS